MRTPVNLSFASLPKFLVRYATNQSPLWFFVFFVFLVWVFVCLLFGWFCDWWNHIRIQGMVFMTITSCGPPVGWPKMKKKRQTPSFWQGMLVIFNPRWLCSLLATPLTVYIFSWWITRDASKRPFSNITICTHHINRQGARQLCSKSSATWAPTRPSNVVLPNASQHLMCTFPVRSSENTKPVGRPPHRRKTCRWKLKTKYQKQKI